jgi:hypothetical protein
VATSALRVTPGFFAFHILLRGKPWRMSGYAPDPQRYEAITYARCGRSGLKLPRISLGLWHNFGGMDPIANQRALLRRSFDLGITHFDLANNYGPPPGSAEENFAPPPAGGLRRAPRRAHHLDQGRLPHVARPLRRMGLAQKSPGLLGPELEALGPALRGHFLSPPARPRHADGGIADGGGRCRALGPRALRRHLEL